MYIRKSMIESYQFCPRQFYHQYILGTPQHETMAMLMGTRFHDFAEKFFGICMYTDVSDWHTFVPEEFNPTERTMAEFFIDTEIERFHTVDYFMPVALEITLLSTRLGITGTIDRIDLLNANGDVELVEYKTGQKVDDASLLRQLSFYKLLVEDTLGYTVTSYKLVNPRVQVVLTYDVPKDPFTSTDAWIRRIREAIDHPELIKPSCSEGKFAACHMCATLDEAGLYPDITYETLSR